MKKQSRTIEWSVLNQNELDSSDLMLVNAAKEATSGSWSPYSGFKVGAALLLDDGTVVTGSNQENAAYPSGTSTISFLPLRLNFCVETNSSGAFSPPR